MDQKEPASGSVGSSINGLEGTLNQIFVEKSPIQLPESFKSFIVAVAPWITVIMLIVTLPALFVLFGLSLFTLPLMAAAAVTSGYMYYISLITAVGIIGLSALAIPGLFARKKSAWNLIFYSYLLSFVGSIFGGSIISAIISLIVSLYFLFQIRSYYK